MDSDTTQKASESEMEVIKYSVFGSGTESENMHGGHDPEESTGVKAAYLSSIGVKPGQTIEGSIQPRLTASKNVELNAISLDPSQMEELVTHVKNSAAIEVVNLRNCGIDDNMFDKLAEALVETTSDIRMLNLNLNKLGPHSADLLAEVLDTKPNIQILLLHGNPLGDHGIKSIVDGLIQSTQSTESESKKNHVSLKELDLGDTNIADEGVQHVAKILRKVASLKSLNLNGNKNISKDGWKLLAKALRRNTSLENLSLDFCNIGDDGMAYLVLGLRNNLTLTSLDLEHAGIGKAGARHVLDLVKSNTSIMDITLGPGNSIPQVYREEIKKYLSLNKVAALNRNKTS